MVGKDKSNNLNEQLKRNYSSLEIGIISFSYADGILTLNGSNEQFDNGTNDGTWEEFEG